MILKIIRAMLGKGDEEYEVEMNVTLGLFDILFGLVLVVAIVWMLV